VEREASEALFLDEYQGQGKTVLEQAAALHETLTGRVV
jgi:hypothetical protein